MKWKRKEILIYKIEEIKLKHPAAEFELETMTSSNNKHF